MSISIVTSGLLATDILTQNMPLSDSFNKAMSASTRQGVHHGFTLEYKQTVAADWPMKELSTRYLRLKAGKLEVAASLIQNYAHRDDIYCVVTLASDLDIDLEALSTPIISSDNLDYYVVLTVDYSPSAVSNLSGMISSLGTLAASIKVISVSGNEGWASQKGIVLGKLNRAYKALESVAQNVMDISSVWSSVADAPNSFKDMTTSALTEFRRAVNIDNYSNLKKHVRLEGLKNINIDSTLALSAITAGNMIPATSASHVNSWARPVNWYTESAESIYVTKGIWKDVEKFELLNSQFASDVALCFHRTPGHNAIQTMYNAAPANLMVENAVRAIPDKGSRSLTLDFKGSVFYGNLSIDLVLDFTGATQDCLYHVNVKNLVVMGNLQVHYGQSWLGMAGGAQATVTSENVFVYGTNALRPWPQVYGLTPATAIVNSNYPEFTTVECYLNSAGNVTFSGFTGTPPAIMAQWRKVSDAQSATTKGVLLLCYHHNAVSGSGALAMGNPWLQEATVGAFIIKNSTIPDFDKLGSGGMSPYVRVALRGSYYWQDKGTAASDGLMSTPSLWKTRDDIVLINSFSLSTMRRLYVYAITVESSVLADSLTLANTLIVGGDTYTKNVVVDGNLDASGNLAAIGGISAGTDFTAGSTIYAGLSILAGTDISAGNDIFARRNITAAGNIVSSGGGLTIAGDSTLHGDVAINGTFKKSVLEVRCDYVKSALSAQSLLAGASIWYKPGVYNVAVSTRKDPLGKLDATSFGFLGAIVSGNGVYRVSAEMLMEFGTYPADLIVRPVYSVGSLDYDFITGVTGDTQIGSWLNGVDGMSTIMSGQLVPIRWNAVLTLAASPLAVNFFLKFTNLGGSTVTVAVRPYRAALSIVEL